LKKSQVGAPLAPGMSASQMEPTGGSTTAAFFSTLLDNSIVFVLFHLFMSQPKQKAAEQSSTEQV
jgi:hypothetical protein